MFLDGATGSELDRRGVDVSRPLWSANANIVAPDVLKQIHKEYLQNGAQALTTNTFRSTERRFKYAGKVGMTDQNVRTAVQMALSACKEVNNKAVVLGSVGPLE